MNHIEEEGKTWSQVTGHETCCQTRPYSISSGGPTKRESFVVDRECFAKWLLAECPRRRVLHPWMGSRMTEGLRKAVKKIWVSGRLKEGWSKSKETPTNGGTKLLICILSVTSSQQTWRSFYFQPTLWLAEKKISPMLLAKKCFILNVQWTWYTSTLWFTIWQQLEY